MRYFLIIKETMGKDRTIEILDSSTDSKEGIDRLIAISDAMDTQIIEGKCKIYMTTYVE